MKHRTIRHLAAGLALACLMPSLALGAVKSKPVEYQHDGVTFKGLLVWDDATKGKRPGVMVVHEWWGLNEYARSRAEMLARMGYVAFAADMYGQGQMTAHAPEAKGWMEQVTANVDRWRARALTALALLRSQPQVDPTRVAAIGYCFGGATVMQMAYAGADLKGVASFHGSLPLATGIAPGTVKAKVLAAHGAADTFVQAERVLAFQKALEDAGVVWEFVTYGGAKHSFTVPGAEKAGMDGMAYYERADKRSWGLLRTFLKEIFSEK